MEITEGTKVQFSVDSGTLAGTVTRVWLKEARDRNLTIISEDGRTFVRCTSRVTPLVPCDRCDSLDLPAYADRHAATHRRDDRNHADRVAADAALRTGPAATAAEHLGLRPSGTRPVALRAPAWTRRAWPTADPRAMPALADVIGQVPDASRARPAGPPDDRLAARPYWPPTRRPTRPRLELVEWCRSARDLLADFASWTDAR